MNLIWLGKYRSFFENLSLYTNVYGQAYTIQGFHGTSVPCSLAQIQVLEYILENEEENQQIYNYFLLHGSVRAGSLVCLH